MRKSRSYTFAAVLAAVTIVTALSCSDDDTTNPVDDGNGGGNNNANTVVMRNNHFVPGTLTVGAGTTVTWKNEDNTPHTVTSTGDPAFGSSGTLSTAATLTSTFATPGTYNYICTLHPGMSGVIIVTP